MKMLPLCKQSEPAPFAEGISFLCKLAFAAQYTLTTFVIVETEVVGFAGAVLL